MSCTTTPINIKSTTDTCNKDCSFKYYYNPTSSAVVTNTGEYLDINVDGKNTVSFKNENLTIKEIKICQPSYHLFNGKQADAEIIIVHSGIISGIVNVCIPITKQNGSGDSNSFFKKIIPYVVGENNEKQQINVSNWSLNNVFPAQAPYYYYISNTLPFNNCIAGTAHFIVFDTANSATIDDSVLKTLKTLLKPITFSSKQIKTSTLSSSNQPLLMYNKQGVKSLNNNDSGDDYYILENCQAVSGLDDDSTTTNITKEKGGIPGWIIGIIFAIILLVTIYFVISALSWSRQGDIGGDTGNVGGNETLDN